MTQPTARQYAEHSNCPVCEEFRADLAKSDAAAADQLRAVMEELKESQAENELLRKCCQKYSVNVRNACTVLGGEPFLEQDAKDRMYYVARKTHDYLRKLVDEVDKMAGGQ